jgi:hypothetical protein
MIKNQHKLIVGALLASGVLNNSYGSSRALEARMNTYVESSRALEARASALAREETDEERRQADRQMHFAHSFEGVRDEGDIPGVMAQIGAGARPDGKNPGGFTLWHLARNAVACGLAGRLGLSRQINQRNDLGYTPLQTMTLHTVAVIADEATYPEGVVLDCLETVRALLRYGADPYDLDEDMSEGCGRTVRQMCTDSFNRLVRERELSPGRRVYFISLDFMLGMAEDAGLLVNSNAERDAMRRVQPGRLAIIKRLWNRAEDEGKKARYQERMRKALQEELAVEDDPGIRQYLVAAVKPGAVIAELEAVAEAPVQKGWVERGWNYLRSFFH